MKLAQKIQPAGGSGGSTASKSKQMSIMQEIEELEPYGMLAIYSVAGEFGAEKLASEVLSKGSMNKQPIMELAIRILGGTLGMWVGNRYLKQAAVIVPAAKATDQ